MKKSIKIIGVIFIIIIVVLIVRRIYYANIEIKPNDVYLSKENSEDNIKMNIGTYSWNDKGIDVISDSISAQDMGNLKTLNVKQDEKIYFTDCDWNSANARLLLINGGNVAGISMEINVDENYIVVPNFEGEYIVQIDLKSDKGDVWYAAKLNITK